jgi:proline racemase/trans-L-3-hydroxyproline dehydratase
MTFSMLRATDYHTGGEPFRVIADPPVPIEGGTVAEKRLAALGDPQVNRMRELACFEPRGHADMYGGVITAPDDSGAHFGVLFWHKDGFSTACGHGTIALGVWAVDTGRVPAPGTGTTDVIIDVPSGRVTARVHAAAGRITEVDFVNVPSFVIGPAVTVPTTRGVLTVATSFGGAIYAQLDAAAAGLTVDPANLGELIALGREIKAALNDTPHARHPHDDSLSGLYGTILYQDLGTDEAGNPHQRNVTIFADGQVDRSPCGSGTCARAATLAATGHLREGETLIHDSIVGSRFTATITNAAGPGGLPAVLPTVTGMAYRTGEHVFEIDPDDPLTPGFVLR